MKDQLAAQSGIIISNALYLGVQTLNSIVQGLRLQVANFKSSASLDFPFTADKFHSREAQVAEFSSMVSGS